MMLGLQTKALCVGQTEMLGQQPCGSQEMPRPCGFVTCSCHVALVHAQRGNMHVYMRVFLQLWQVWQSP